MHGIWQNDEHFDHRRVGGYIGGRFVTFGAEQTDDKLKQAGFRWTGNMEEEVAKTLVLCEESRIGGT